jgi:hypothetical protein
MLPLMVEVLARLALSVAALLVGFGLVAWGRAGHDADTERARAEASRARADDEPRVDEAGEPAIGADESTVVLLSDGLGDWRG